ncbi:MAG: energy-coupling factor transporter ATPase [Syntrophomonadaceae bacterium]|nr:energy-coupling factor transporter ATPase [Syntrophomonadaceae bacterium]
MALLLEDLSHVYMPGTPFETKALEGVNLKVATGEMVAIIGPTGSGKSTLVQHLNGLLKPTSGRIQVDDLDLSQARSEQFRALRQKVGLVFQFPEEQLFEETVFMDIAFGPRNLGLPEEKIASRVRWAMEAVGLNYKELHQRSPFHLSGGQMRRVAIAGVLAMHPQILILDEPTAGLDPQSRDSLLRQIRFLWKKLSLTVLLVTHHLSEVAVQADRIIVMHQGRIILDGKPGAVFQEVDILRDIGLGVPLVSAILSGLREKGWPLPANLVSVEEAAYQIAKIYRQNRSKAGLDRGVMSC